MNHESQTVSAVAEQWKQVLSDLLYVDSVHKTFCTYTYLHTIQRDFNQFFTQLVEHFISVQLTALVLWGPHMIVQTHFHRFHNFNQRQRSKLYFFPPRSHTHKDTLQVFPGLLSAPSFITFAVSHIRSLSLLSFDEPITSASTSVSCELKQTETLDCLCFVEVSGRTSALWFYPRI